LIEGQYAEYPQLRATYDAIIDAAASDEVDSEVRSWLQRAYVENA
jgi:hypothetical protein